ncbi:MAG: 30S ribosomal protein S12 methylthiotransferase RimO [Candidatus Gastranaerophilaceae bacterium]|jgi:ribosomal protein S12 methylthiotransferase
MKKPVVGLINHGCPKNLVDAELMLGMLSDAGFGITLDENKADIIIINTCSFIHDAEKESVRSILEIAQTGKKLVITGCLPQKYKKELLKEIPEAVAFIGTSDIDKIVSVINSLAKNNSKQIFEVTSKPAISYPENVMRQQITVGSSSYLKIAEGCNYKCGYCIIPQLRGPYKSRKIEDIVKEAKWLGDKGVSEIVLIAQDTSYYGIDIYGEPKLAELLNKLNEIESINWIRVMYTYPSMINDELIEAFANLDKVVKYIDIPLQHSHPDVLKLMNRPQSDYSELIKKLRAKIKGIAIRTTFIVGYPTENDEHFEHLYNFVKNTKFDKLGVFEYSKEKNTTAYALKPQISSKIKKERKNKLMILQKEISKEIHKSLIGKKLPTIIETVNSDGSATGRTYRDAPEVDGLVYIKTRKNIVPGDIEIVKITAADDYDLYGTV